MTAVNDMNMEHDTHPTDLLPAYALGILDPAEEAGVDAHLETCPQCRAEVAAFGDVAQHLALAVPEVETPVGLRQRVLAEVHQIPAAARREDVGHWWQRIGLGLHQRGALSMWRPAAIGLIFLLVISNIYFWYRLHQLESQPPLYQQAINLGGTDNAPDASGMILIRQDEQRGTLVVNGLPVLDSDRQYQLWLVHDEERISGAVFSVTDKGYASILISAPAALPSYSRFGITIEPTGGSPGPTGEGVLRSTAR